MKGFDLYIFAGLFLNVKGKFFSLQNQVMLFIILKKILYRASFIKKIKTKSYFKQKFFSQIVFILHHCFHIDIHHYCHSHLYCHHCLTLHYFTDFTCSGSQFLHNHRICYIGFEFYCTSKCLLNTGKFKYECNSKLLIKFWSFVFVIVWLRFLHVMN